MVQINWSEGALRDLRHIYEYIAKDSPAHAQEQIERIESHINMLSRHPRLGKVISEPTVLQYRELVEHPYRVIYRFYDTGTVGIVAVVHGRRMLFR